MRLDQLVMLDEIADRLADVFILEADPKNWPGTGKLPVDMTREERGDRHWCRKGAIGTGAVLKYVLDIRARQAPPAADPDASGAPVDTELDAAIERAQQMAAAAMERVRNKSAGKAEFDKRVHGRQG